MKDGWVVILFSLLISGFFTFMLIGLYVVSELNDSFTLLLKNNWYIVWLCLYAAILSAYALIND